MAFRPRGELAWGQIEAALAAGIPRGPVLMDAGYGSEELLAGHPDEAALRDRMTARGLTYAVGIRPLTTVWWSEKLLAGHPDEHQPAATPVNPALSSTEGTSRGWTRSSVRRDTAHQPVGVRELAQALPASHYRTVTWREGTNAPLSSRFARVRVSAAQGDQPPCRGMAAHRMAQRGGSVLGITKGATGAGFIIMRVYVLLPTVS